MDKRNSNYEVMKHLMQEKFSSYDIPRITAYNEADVQRILNTEGMLKSERKV